MDPIDSLSLCESDQLLSVAGREDCSRVTHAMSQQAAHSLYIFDDELEPALYDSPDFVASARRIATGDVNATLRILFYSPDKLLHRCHHLPELTRRLSSRVEIRQLSRAYHHAFFVADGCGVVDRRVASRFEGIASFNDPGRAAELIAFFNTCWEMSSRNMELQALQI
ncbi:hypothetical protein [Thiohalophilus sp.]|uniref:DUF7931 domain-containing protein n=1 Tax=Thiohalophilus sp. TaxID=3028392 RepID=UPI002ACE73F0|nr:hypothetical protein [Thiohalophilus sp.]MDZ7804971.1 hypothetical protein [Thiohalophilus sp.]